MAGATLNLAAIQALIALGGYGGRGNNSASSAVVGLSAALFLSDLSIWQGASDTLTDAEIDDIQELVATLENDLMVTDEMYPQDRVQATSSIPLIIPHATNELLLFDTNIYDPSGMHSETAFSGRFYVQNDGLHLIEVSMSASGNTVGYRFLRLYRYDFSVPIPINIRNQLIPNTLGLGNFSFNFSAQDVAEAGDWYYLLLYQTSGANLTVVSDFSSPFLSVVRL